MTKEADRRSEAGRKLDRIIIFSDAVFAIDITADGFCSHARRASWTPHL